MLARIGSNAGIHLSTGDSNIDIGNQGVAGDSAKIRIGSKGRRLLRLSLAFME
jgi:hypothetical protein